MPQFWVMMSAREKIKLMIFGLMGVLLVYFYISLKDIGPVIKQSDVRGSVHSIQATSPLSGVASAYGINVKLTDGRIVTVEVPTSANITVGSAIELTEDVHKNGISTFVAK